MRYQDSAKVCFYNYCRDFGYEDSVENIKEIVDLDNCNTPEEFLKRLRSIKLSAAITTIPFNHIQYDKEVPYFAVCKIDEHIIFLPVYKIDKNFVLVKNSKGNTTKIKTIFFKEIYQGKIIEIIYNGIFLKEHFLKEDHKKRFTYTLLASIFGGLLVISWTLFFISLFSNLFPNGFKIAIYITFAISPILFIVFFVLAMVTDHRIKEKRKGRNKSYDDGKFYNNTRPTTSGDVENLIIEGLSEILRELLKNL